MTKKKAQEEFEELTAPSQSEISEYRAFRSGAKNKVVEGYTLSPHQQWTLDRQQAYLSKGEFIIKECDGYAHSARLEPYYHAPQMPPERVKVLLDEIKARVVDVVAARQAPAPAEDIPF